MGAFRRFRSGLAAAASVLAFAAPAASAEPAERVPEPGLEVTRDITVSGYLQTEYQSHQDSEDQLRQGHVALNQNRFLLRRTRLRASGDWGYAAGVVELDANTIQGPLVGVRIAEGSLVYRRSERELPLVQASMGLMNTPFGYELQESSRDRPFMERSLASRAFWPGEPDVGVRISGALGFFRWTFAALDGEPLDERTGFPGRDPNEAKDVMFRAGIDLKPLAETRVSGGISGSRGKGFHAGTDATKSRVDWRDANEDGVVQSVELVAVPGLGATPSANFDRWVFGADLQVAHHSRYGSSKLYGEVYVAQNMDRDLFIADPVATGVDARALGFFAAAVQDVTRYGLVGLRVDYYDPNADVFDRRGGKLVPFTQAITTVSPLVGFVLPERAKLLFQYDLIKDKLARDPRGVPTNFKNNAWTLRLQVML